MVKGPVKTTNHQVISVRELTEQAIILRVERNRFNFKAGQFVNLALNGEDTTREYTIYSGTGDNYLEFLIKVIPDGFISPRLAAATSGDYVVLDGPYDERFTIHNPGDSSISYIFIGTGTGIAPYKSYVLSHPNLSYTVVHGIAYANETYDKDTYSNGTYISCVSRESGGDYHGHVTEWLRDYSIQDNELIYLCGSSNMIFEVTDMLKEKGISEERIYSEVFF